MDKKSTSRWENRIPWKLLRNIIGTEIVLWLLPRGELFSWSTFFWGIVLMWFYRTLSREERVPFRVSLSMLMILHYSVVHMQSFSTSFSQSMAFIVFGILLFILSSLFTTFFSYRFVLYGVFNTILLFLVILYGGGTTLSFENIDFRSGIVMGGVALLIYEALLFYGIESSRRAGVYGIALGLISAEIMSQMRWFPLTIVQTSAFLTLFLVLFRDGILVALKGFLTPSYMLRALVIFIGIGSIIFAFSSWKLVG